MGCMNIALVLVGAGAGADAATARGETPLHLAARAHQTDLVRVLLRNNAKVILILLERRNCAPKSESPMLVSRPVQGLEGPRLPG